MKLFKTLLHLNFLKSKRYWSEIRRWSEKAKENSGIRVFYGHDHIPKRGEKAGGGIIKCQDLAELFPNTLKDANILYLISSALPHFAPIIVRIAKRHGVRLVWNQNGVAYPGWHGPGWDGFNRDMKMLLHMADYVIYQSDFCKLSADRYLGKFNGPSAILHNPVDTSIFMPASVLPEGKNVLLAGSHEHFYRVKCALEMIVFLKNVFPEIQLTVAGRYSWQADAKIAQKEAEHLAIALGVDKEVSFLGSYTQEEAVPLFQSAHVLIHTKFNDPCPRLVVEAMACGLPVVYSASGGMPELVAESAGVGVEAPLDWEKDHPPEPEQLADAVIKVFQNYSEYRKNARFLAESKLDAKMWLSKHKDVFCQVLGLNI